VGTLLAGVLVGQLGIQVPPLVKTVFFDLFLFTTGYKVGPQFFRGLKKDAFSQVALTVVLCVTCLLTAFVASKILGYDPGTAAGLLAGAFSESTVIGTAGEAINRLAISPEEKTRLVNNIPIAYAVTYLLGTAGLVWYLPVIGPKLMGVDLKTESKKAQSEAPGTAAAEAGVSAARRFDVRAYRMTNVDFRDRTIAQLEALSKTFRFFVLRIRRDGELIDAPPSMVLRAGDVIAVAAPHQQFVLHGDKIGPEVEDRALLDIPIESVDVVVTNRSRCRTTIRELATTSPGVSSCEGRALGRRDAGRPRPSRRPGRRDDSGRHEARGGAGGQAHRVSGLADERH
jgi:putative transport protein